MDIPKSFRRVGGITLVELLIALALAGILLAGAIPNFHTLWLNNRLSTTINQFVTTLHGARSHAIMRRERSVLCPSRNGQECTDTTDWQAGWILFVDSNASRQREADEDLLHIQMELAKDLHIHSDPGRRQITYQVDGRAGGSNNTLVFCDDRGPSAARAVVISNTGRPRVVKTLPGKTSARCASN